MRWHLPTSIILSVTFLSACAMSEGTGLYKSGSKALERGDYRTCINDLEKARDLLKDKSSRVHNNLGVCYNRVGREKDAWIEFRAAVITNPLNQTAQQNFLTRWHQFRASGVLARGATTESIMTAMGRPDVMSSSKDGSEESWIYGNKTLQFKDGKLRATQ